jgi:polysaccharide export outer membrane protein
VRVSRRKPDGKLDALEPRLDDPIRPDDLIFIRESIF